MMQQVHLYTPYIDGPHTAALEFLDRSDCGLLGRKERAGPFSIDGIGPGVCFVSLIRQAGFGAANSSENARRKVQPLFGSDDRLIAQHPG
jgi:hypothetical protein